MLERPEGARPTETALLPELLVDLRHVGAGSRMLAGLLVRELDLDVVLEALDVLTADVLVELPDAAAVEPLGVEDQDLHETHRARLQPLCENTSCTPVVLS